jgi:hypothetical protein
LIRQIGLRDFGRAKKFIWIEEGLSGMQGAYHKMRLPMSDGRLTQRL